MNFHPAAAIVTQLRALYFGGNWTSVNYRDTLKDVDWISATTKKDAFHTIAELVYHSSYYIHAVIRVLNGASLDAHDQFSFDLPPIRSAEDWNALLQQTWTVVETLAGLIETIDAGKWQENFVDEKYGSYYRNMTGIIEHNHYHLGQIVLLKKLITSSLVE